MSRSDHGPHIPSTHTEFLAWKKERIQDAGSVLALIAVALGCFGLLSWLVGRESWTQLVPTGPVMVPNTALGLSLAGAATLLLRARRGRARRGLAAVFAAVVLGIGLLTLAEYIGQWNLGIDLLLVKRSGVGPYPNPSRPSILTACCFVFVGLSLELDDWRLRVRSRPAEWLALCGGFIAIVSLLGHLYGAPALYAFGTTSSIGVALPTGTALLCVVAGILLLRPEQGWTRIILDGGLRGSLVRRLGGASVAVPILFGVIASQLARHGFSDTALLLGLLVALVIPGGLLLVSVTGKEVAQAHAALTKSRDQAQALFEHAADGIFIAGPDGLYVDVNPVGCRMLGYTREEILGRSIVEFVPPGDLQRQAELRQHILQGGVDVSEWRLRRKDGTYVPVEMSATTLPDGRPMGFVRDITARRTVEEVVRLSEAKFSAIVALSADAIVSFDEDQRIILFNDGAEKIFGYSKAEAIGARHDILLAEQHRSIHGRHVEQFAAGEVTARQMGERNSTIVGRRKNGEEFPVDVSISKLEVGGKRLFTAVLRDITERKRSETEARLLAEAGKILVSAGPDYKAMLTDVAKLIISNIADWCSIDVVQDGQIRRAKVIHSDPAKTAICDALERYPVHQRPTLVSDVVQSQSPVLVSDVTPEYLETLAQSAEHLQLLQGLGPSSFIIVPLIARGQSLGTLAFGASNGSRRYGDLDVRLAESLAIRAALALDNARLHVSLERAVQARDDVLGIVAHDLRNPLNNIGLWAQTLGRRLSKEGAVENKKSVEKIRSSVQRANRLIEDLLDVTRIEAGQLSVELGPFPSGQLVLDVVEQQQLVASNSSIELRSEIELTLPEVWGDRNRCLQILENLIGNALKFTPAGGRVTVGAAPGDGEVRFWVADTGAGIAAESLPHVFDRFWQAKKTERRGAGLGLQICKGLVEAHGGRIWVESTLGRGTTFHFTVLTRRAISEQFHDDSPKDRSQ